MGGEARGPQGPHGVKQTARKGSGPVSSASGEFAPGPRTASNLSLSFFDYCCNCWDHRETAPAQVCILNQGLFAWLTGGHVTNAPSKETVPTLLSLGDDTLLVYVYLLLRDVVGGQPGRVLGTYSSKLLDNLSSFGIPGPGHSGPGQEEAGSLEVQRAPR